MQEMLWTALAVLLIGFLAVNAPAYYLGGILFLTRSRRECSLHSSETSTTILVPARNEGKGSLRAVQSLAAQDCSGRLEIALLVRDETDTSVPFLREEFPEARAFPGGVELMRTPLRSITIHYTGRDAKHAKINWMIPRVDTEWTAILDADHEAHADWIRTSLALLEKSDSRIIQGRREPLSAHGLFGLWDSLHQHIGCEVFNEAFHRMGLTVFFTGSTAVFVSALLREHPLDDCLTEDTNLSYERILAGEKILYNRFSGSREEVSPDLYSFLARRRRWAHGHTEAFFRNLGAFWKAPLGVFGRIQFLFHGFHYLVALAVVAAHALIGLAIAPRFEPGALASAAFAGLVLSVSIVRSQHMRRPASALAATVLLFLWLTPAALFAMGAMHGIFAGDFSHMALPAPAWLQFLAFICLAAPLFMLLSGLAGFRQLGPGITAAVLLTYPVSLVLYISGAVIGLIDLLSGQKIWHVIGRASVSHAGPGPRGIRDSWRTRNLMAKIRTLVSGGRDMKPGQWIIAVLVTLALALGIYFGRTRELTVAPHECSILEHDGDPWIVQPKSLPGYCGPGSVPGKRTGSFSLARKDDLKSIDPAYWDRLNTTFFCNEAVFSPDNVQTSSSGMQLVLKEEAKGGKAYTAGSIATRDSADSRHLYGRFEVELKPARVSGVLTAFFLYRFDPWQEIDMEFPGRDTSKVLLNVFYNPGAEGDLYNYGYRGTPVLIDLGFDAAEAFHTYAIEWDPGEIRWFVDGALIHARPAGKPTPIPHLPMRFHVNSWPICSEELAGKLDKGRLPVSTGVRSISIFRYNPPLVDRFFKKDSGQWRDEAKWMRSGK